MKVETEYTELSLVNAGVSQCSVLEPFLSLLYTADLPTSTEFTTATFAENTEALVMGSDPATASQKLQTNPDAIQKWLKKLRIKDNEYKSVHVTLTT
jgi:hypothetical protein